MSHPVFRFAPSPNGYLHLGHAMSAILNYDMAKQSGGRFLLRIEDIDTLRCRPKFIDAIYEDLDWLGLKWEEPVRRQSEHFDDYAKALNRLKAMGFAFPSVLSRKEIEAHVQILGGNWPRDPEGTPLYPGDEYTRPIEEQQAYMDESNDYALRLNMERAYIPLNKSLSWYERKNGQLQKIPAFPVVWGDFIIARKDIGTSYHLSVVVDDALQGVTHIVRGQDLYDATSVHILLQSLLGLPQPLYFHHHLLKDASGAKLSKSASATPLRDLRRQGVTPDQIREKLELHPGQYGF
jgi:glutamyl-Q tRNA(Asp) synthetase